jgi:hypothetical protein
LNSFDRRLAFTPSLPQLWFEIERGEDLSSRAIEVLTRYFRGREKINGKAVPNPEDVSVKNKAWASTVEIEFDPPLLAKTPREEFRTMLGGGETMDGEWELEQVGRCLDWLYPNDLSRVIAREHEVKELTESLQSPDRRPTLLVGPRMVGKTAIIEECIYRRVARQRSQYKSKNNVWLIAPQGLISGMSYRLNPTIGTSVSMPIRARRIADRYEFAAAICPRCGLSRQGSRFPSTTCSQIPR